MLHNLRNLPNFCGVGDTFGYDLSLGQDLSAKGEDQEIYGSPRIIRILLGACGDIRNLLKAVSSLQQCAHLQFQVVLNDWNLAILARNVVKLALDSTCTAFN